MITLGQLITELLAEADMPDLSLNTEVVFVADSGGDGPDQEFDLDNVTHEYDSSTDTHKLVIR